MIIMGPKGNLFSKKSHTSCNFVPKKMSKVNEVEQRDYIVIANDKNIMPYELQNDRDVSIKINFV